MSCLWCWDPFQRTAQHIVYYASHMLYMWFSDENYHQCKNLVVPIELISIMLYALIKHLTLPEIQQFHRSTRLRHVCPGSQVQSKYCTALFIGRIIDRTSMALIVRNTREWWETLKILDKAENGDTKMSDGNELTIFYEACNHTRSIESITNLN